jgi:hypothetical protein
MSNQGCQMVYVLSNQNVNLGIVLKVLVWKISQPFGNLFCNVGIFYGPSAFLLPFWDFFPFGLWYQGKSGNPVSNPWLLPLKIGIKMGTTYSRLGKYIQGYVPTEKITSTDKFCFFSLP